MSVEFFIKLGNKLFPEGILVLPVRTKLHKLTYLMMNMSLEVNRA